MADLFDLTDDDAFDSTAAPHVASDPSVDEDVVVAAEIEPEPEPVDEIASSAVSVETPAALESAIAPYVESGQQFLGGLDQDVIDDLRTTDMFKRITGELETEYRCPRCGGGWSGNPKPPLDSDVDDVDA